MKDKIQNAVNALVGLPMWSLGRAVDLVWFEFGGRLSKITKVRRKKLAIMRCMSNAHGALRPLTR